jgi:ubiquinone/menaquinone biosynthesis C-methylase UbiE
MIFRILFSCLAGVPWNFGPLNHLQIAKSTWAKVISTSPATVIDATCGNGHDAEYLSSLLDLQSDSGQARGSKIYCIDIQEEAIEATKHRLLSKCHPMTTSNFHFIHGSHETFPSEIQMQSVTLICYNLGYLPRSQKDEITQKLTTQTSSTLKSLEEAQKLLKEEGLLSVTAYPGHEGGDLEAIAVRTWMENLSPMDWRVYGHFPLNRPKSPQLYLAYKIGKGKNQ